MVAIVPRQFSNPGAAISKLIVDLEAKAPMLSGWADSKSAEQVGVELQYAIVDVFAHAIFRGVAVAIVFDADGLSTAQMSDIAREFNLTTTAFVLKPRDPSHTGDVRIFTPKEEVPFAGHPGIGIGYAMARRSSVSSDKLLFAVKAGVVDVVIERQERAVVGASLTAPQKLSTRPGPPAEAVAAALRLSVDEIATSMHPPIVASVGSPYLIVEASDVVALKKASIDQALLGDIRMTHDVRGLHLYVNSSTESGRRIQARNFSPHFGIGEDPATGSATASLAGVLAQFAPGKDCDLHLEAHQGLEVGRPSVIQSFAAKRNGVVSRPRLAGKCILTMRGVLSV